ncbi:ethylbenzene dehydrogenase-related protein [Dinoroseobacter sp. S375]|uniref:ethylbenzene dehydrogenase-related protein n=1 Tax=Dinoroseobacter sp. S375 TaxID=3415136 RepID=UPI003C7992C1
MMRHLSQTLAATALLALAAPVFAEGSSIIEANVKLLEAGDTVAASRIPDGIYLRRVNDPNDIIWERLPEYRVHVAPAPSVHESVDLRIDYDDEGQDVYLTMARTSERFYVRMRWRDAQPDLMTSSNRFRDAAAVQFSLGDDATSYLMGDGPDAPVNIWYWRSDRGEVQNLAAGGPGSTTMLDNQPVSGAAEFVDKGSPAANEWSVVMSRPIPTTGDYEVSFRRGEVPMAFAIWQGSDGQRDGLKSVSDGWILVSLEES